MTLWVARSARRWALACAGVALLALVVTDPTASRAEPPSPLTLAEYFQVLDACRPPWDPTGTNVVTGGEGQLDYEPSDSQQVFLDV